MGKYSGNAITTGVSNTGFGAHTLNSCTTGGHNMAFGAHALLGVTTGTHNQAHGYQAGDAITTGGYNVAIGSNALGAATTSVGCIAIGSSAGGGITDGHNNIMIGREAGEYGTTTTTGEKNVIVGGYCRADSAGGDTQIVMGYDVAGYSSSYFTFGHGSSDTVCPFGATNWSNPSDERMKKDVETSIAGLNFVNDLRPVTFKWKNKGEIPSEFNGYVEGSTEAVQNTYTNHGFIAQEVKTAIDAHPELKDGFDMWMEGGDGRQRIGDTALIPILTKAIQELSAKNDALEARITTLEG